MSESYQEIRSKSPKLFECFFAFSREQINEGIKKNNLEGVKIYSAPQGLFGTKAGIEKLYADYDQQDVEIVANCDPQKVYDYESNNHECSYTNDDEEAIKIVIGLFGMEKAKEVKRRFAYLKIEEIKF